MTKNEVMALVAELKAEEKKTEYRPHLYKRNGIMVERSCPDIIRTDRYNELFYSDASPIRKANIFRCEDCGRMVNYFDLENWCCDFDTDDYICSECYENGMGEDL